MKEIPILTVTHLVKHFIVRGNGLLSPRELVRAVDGISFTINKRETLGLVGESGCGKTTAGRCILRLIELTAGQIVFNSTDIATAPPATLQKLRRDMQIIFQDPYGSLTPRMRISSLLTEPLDVHGIGSKSERRERVAAILEKVGLRLEHLSRYPHEFSGGQRQRISIARALMVNPTLIIADEPVSALDVSIRAQILNLLVKLQQEFDLAYLLISHDLSVVKYMCDTIAVMYLGRIVELGTRDEIYENVQHPYTEALLSAIPIPAVGERKGRMVLSGDVPSPINPPQGCRFHPRCPCRKNGCDTADPVLKDIGNGHLVACHLREG